MLRNIYSSIFSQINNGERTAIDDNDRLISYDELNARIHAFSYRLSSQSFRPGDRIGIFLANTPSFVIAYFSILKLGAVVVLIDIKMQEEIHSIVKETGLRAIVTDADGVMKLERILSGKTSHFISVPTLIADDLDRGPICEEFEDTIQEYTPKPGDEAVILYTSGSIGMPKGVVNTHETILEAVDNYRGSLPITKDDVLVAVTPFFHSYAMGSVMLAGLASGSKLLTRAVFQPRAVMDLITCKRATLFHGIPYTYNLMIQHYQREQYCFDSIRFFISAGSKPLKRTMEDFFGLTGKVIHQEYGSSESGTIAINKSEDLAKNVLSVGQALRNVKVKIEQDNGDGGKEGRILIKSKGRAVGYLNQSAFDSLEWYDMGDVGYLDDDGYIHITGRTKNMIIVAGLKVNPMEVIDTLRRHPKVVDALVRGYEHPDFGEGIETIIQTKDRMLSADEIIDYCGKNLALYKVPTKVSFVKELKRSGSGKIRYNL